MSPTSPDPDSSRTRVVRGAARLIRERGIHGVGMRQVVEFSETPRGSLQRYFPGGKAQLAAEAVLLAIAEFPSGFPAALTADTLAAAVGLALAPWRRQLTSSDFAVGCPLMPIVVDGVMTHGCNGSRTRRSRHGPGRRPQCSNTSASRARPPR